MAAVHGPKRALEPLLQVAGQVPLLVAQIIERERQVDLGGRRPAPYPERNPGDRPRPGEPAAIAGAARELLQLDLVAGEGERHGDLVEAGLALLRLERAVLHLERPVDVRADARAADRDVRQEVPFHIPDAAQRA